MRVKSLELKAFGPFSGHCLEFDSRGPGLHIIFGPNEAGKSSSLRGLKALLYGFHPQTPDNFLHSYDQLLVGGRLENSDGRELVFQRRKKRVNDLLDGDGNPLDKGLLAAFLHGVEPEIFESLYGIDHHSLVAGGNEILAQQGEVGKALFAAGAGISSLREVSEQLEGEASALFKPSGSKPEINRSLKRLKELQSEVKAASLAPKEWHTLQKKMQVAQEERSGLEREREAKNEELRRLERLERAIPELASLNVCQVRLRELGEVTILPLDMGERHQRVKLAIGEAAAQFEKSSERLALVKEKRAAISLNRTLLEQADVVDDFHQRLGEYRKGQKDRPERNGMRISLRRSAALALQQVRPDLSLQEVEALRPVLAKKRTVQTLGSRFEAYTQQVGRAEKQVKLLGRELQEIEKSLGGAPTIRDTQDLEVAVKLARKAGEIDTYIAKVCADVGQQEEDCRKELSRIGHWSGELSALLELALPLAETVERFGQNDDEIATKRRGLEQDRKEAGEALKAAEAELRKLEYGGEVPAESDLRDTRAKRDRGWLLLRRQWMNGENVAQESRVYDPEKPLAEAYESLVHQADTIADRLRNEADRVASAVNLRVRVEQQREILAECALREKDLDQRKKQLDEEWSATWQPLGIAPRSPREMRGWLTAMERLRYRVQELDKKELHLEGEEARRRHIREKLLEELVGIGEKELPATEMLGPVLGYAEHSLETSSRHRVELERLLERRDKTRKALVRAEEEDYEAREMLATWREQWAKALAGLGLKEELSPLEATDYLETLQACLDKLHEADDLQKRIDGIDRDATRLEEEVRALLAKAAPELADLPVDRAILQLRAFLNQAQQDKTLFDRLTEEFDTLQTEAVLAEKNLQNANEQMAELLRIAGCRKVEELGLIIDRFHEYQRLRGEIAAREETLARIGAGQSIDELIAQAEEVHGDALPGRIESLRREIETELHPAISSISQEIGEITSRLATMDGSARAAEASEEVERELAKIRRLAGRYIRVKLAARILQMEIERYREKHQDPVLQIASGYFAELTLTSFSGLKTDVDDRNEPILVGIREDGKWTPVDGMSDGTRDQLYLALRLATLEWRMETSEPMPFIVDDILINFDDDRSRATIAALARLGRKNQVILFTHHRQLVAEAEKLGDTEEVVVHNLVSIQK